MATMIKDCVGKQDLVDSSVPCFYPLLTTSSGVPEFGILAFVFGDLMFSQLIHVVIDQYLLMKNLHFLAVTDL